MLALKTQFHGFTLIELLITIAIVGILSAAVLVGINPIQKINQANDSKAKSDIGQIATAAQSYYTNNQSYPVTAAAGITAMVTSKDLTVSPTAPSGYTYTFASLPAGCTGNTTTPCTSFSISSTIKAPSVSTSNTLWCFASGTGIASEATQCP